MLVYNTGMIGEAAISLEVPVGLEAEVARLRRGDLDALAELVARYQHRLYRYLLRLVRQPAEAEDLFQQTWLRVAGQNPAIRSPAEFRRLAIHAGAEPGD